jgi:dihydrofolate synthase/folylpolyglutamate synthase
VKLGLSRVHEALALRGHPERAVKAVIVAGTNGKGSVSSMIASALTASGHRTGLYTSPHLHRMVERFRVDGRPVSQRDFAQRVSEIRPFLLDPRTPKLTFFEACTLLAFEIFRDAGCDRVVLEVGLGGRLDATNVVDPMLSVITRIALDHQDRLGSTLAEIAREKAGVIHRQVPVVTGEREGEALEVIRRTARSRRAPLWCRGRDFEVRESDEGLWVSVGAAEHGPFVVPLAGAYQADNVAIAVAALVRLSACDPMLTPRALRKGLSRVRFPGRLELIEGAPSVLLDAAHNPDACDGLRQHLVSMPRSARGKRVLLFGCMRDKDHARMLALLGPCFDQIVFTTADSPRAMPATELVARYGEKAVSSPADALALARRAAGKSGLVVVAGSIFVMATVRAELLGLRMDPPIAM